MAAKKKKKKAKKSARQKIHDWDVKNIPLTDWHPDACLSAHVGHYADSNPCSYRAQAYKHADADDAYYKWPKAEKGPRYEAPTTTKKWDIGYPGNFKRKASKPFPFESHHIVPNSELNKALNNVGGKAKAATKLKVRTGLIEEEYKLNDELNMIILPMASRPSKVLDLPRHRRTRAHRSHKAYSKHVADRLKEIMAPMKKTAVNCELPEYLEIRDDIEAISTDLYPQIRDAGPKALDDVPLVRTM